MPRVKKAGDFSPACCFVLYKALSLNDQPHQTSTLGGSSDNANVLCSWAFRALSFSVLHALTFLKIIKMDTFEIRHVEKHVFSRSIVNESKTFVSQLLNRTFSHYFIHFTQKPVPSPMPPETQLQSLKKSLVKSQYCTCFKRLSQLRLKKSRKCDFLARFVGSLPLDGIFHPTYTHDLSYVEGVPTVQGMDRRDSLRS